MPTLEEINSYVPPEFQTYNNINYGATLAEMLGITNTGSVQSQAQLSAAQQQFENEKQAMALQNTYNTSSAQKAMDFNKAQTSMMLGFNASEAEKARLFEAQQAQLANQYNTLSAQKAMDWSAKQAEIQRAYETQMSSTAYQRAVKDLKAAGINPILAAMSGASTPNGATGQAYMSSGNYARGTSASSSSAGGGVALSSSKANAAKAQLGSSNALGSLSNIFTSAVKLASV